MNVTKLIRISGILGMGLLSAPKIFSAENDDPKKMNVIVMLMDDLGYGDIHCLNPDRNKITTPNFDRLANQSMLFTNAHGGASVCTPTRYGLLTGRYAWRTSLQSGVLHIDSEALITEERLTLPKLFKKHGYKTTGMGKWHLGMVPVINNENIEIDKTIRYAPTIRRS